MKCRKIYLLVAAVVVVMVAIIVAYNLTIGKSQSVLDVATAELKSTNSELALLAQNIESEQASIKDRTKRDWEIRSAFEAAQKTNTDLIKFGYSDSQSKYNQALYNRIIFSYPDCGIEFNKLDGTISNLQSGLESMKKTSADSITFSKTLIASYEKRIEEAKKIRQEKYQKYLAAGGKPVLTE